MYSEEKINKNPKATLLDNIVINYLSPSHMEEQIYIF